MKGTFAGILIAAAMLWMNVAEAAIFVLPSNGTVQIVVPEELTNRITNVTVRLEVVGAYGPAYDGTCDLRPFAGIFCDGTNISIISVLTVINVDPTVRSILGLGEYTYLPFSMSQTWGNCSPFHPTCGAFQLRDDIPAGVPPNYLSFWLFGTATLHIMSNPGVTLGDVGFESISLLIELPDSFSVVTPIPPTFSLFATGFAILFLTIRRRR